MMAQICLGLDAFVSHRRGTVVRALAFLLPISAPTACYNTGEISSAIGASDNQASISGCSTSAKMASGSLPPGSQTNMTSNGDGSIFDEQFPPLVGSGSVTNPSIHTPAIPRPCLDQYGKQMDWAKTCLSDSEFKAKYAAFRSRLEDRCGLPLESDPDLEKSLWSVMWEGKRCNASQTSTVEPSRGQPSMQNTAFESNDDLSDSIFPDFHALWSNGQSSVQGQAQSSTPIDYASETGAQFTQLEQRPSLANANPNPNPPRSHTPNENHHADFTERSLSTTGMAASHSPGAATFQVGRPLGALPPLAAQPASLVSQSAVSDNLQTEAGPSRPLGVRRSSKRRKSNLGESQWTRKGDREGYLAMRKTKACWPCFLQKKKCDPKHTGIRDFDHSKDPKELLQAGMGGSP